MLSPVMLGMSEETTLTLKQKCFCQISDIGN